MAYVDEAGNVYTVSNDFSDVVMRMFSSVWGILAALVPLLVLLGMFLIIKHYSKNKKILNAYTIMALLLYIVYFFLLSQLFVTF